MMFLHQFFRVISKTPHVCTYFWVFGGSPVAARSIKRWVAPKLREFEHRRKRAEPRPPQRRSTYLEWNYDAEVFAFGKRIGENFDLNQLRQALTHRSYVVQQEIQGNFDSLTFEDNTDLIRKGVDLITQRITSKFDYPCIITGAISTYLTSTGVLAHVASHMGLIDLILSADYPVEEVTLANTFKAVTAIVQSDRTEDFLDDFLFCQMCDKDIFDVWHIENPYNALLEMGVSLEPRLCNESATNTILANYQVGLYENRKLLGIGWGETIETAKQMAALNVIRKKFIT